MRGQQEPSPRRPDAPALRRLLVVGVFAAFVALAGLWTMPPLDRDEARFAQATTQMLESGDYVAIRFQDRERNKKPAGIHWLQAASVSAVSDPAAREIWAYRLPSVVGVIVAALFTFLAGARLYDQPTGLVAAMLLAAAPLVAAEATIAKTDAMLLALVCIAQYALVEIYAGARRGARGGWGAPILFWTAHGAGALVKGPIGPMISALTGIGLAIQDRSFAWIFRIRLIIGVLILAAMIAPWAWAIHQATDGRFFIDAVGGDMLGKVGEAQERHAGPPGYHTVLLWALFWPAAALIGPGLFHLWRERRSWRARFLLAWIIPSWIVFELAATKLPHYVMPLYPALAIVAAHGALRADGPVALRRLGAAAYAGVSLAAAGLIAVLPRLFADGGASIAHIALAGAFAAAGLGVALAFWRGRARAGAFAASGLAALYAWALMGAVLPGLTQLTVSPRLSAALDAADRHPLRDGAPPVALAGYSEPSAVFLIGTDTALVDGGEAGRRLRAGLVGAAFVEGRENDAFLAAAGADIRALAVIDGLNYSNGDAVELTLYAPAEAP